MSLSPHAVTEDENQVIDRMFAFVKHVRLFIVFFIIASFFKFFFVIALLTNFLKSLSDFILFLKINFKYLNLNG